MTQQRPSAVGLYFRIFIAIFLGLIFFGMIFNGLAGSGYWDFSLSFGIAFWITMLILISRVIHTVIMDTMYKNNPSYQRFRQSGGNMYDVSINPTKEAVNSVRKSADVARQAASAPDTSEWQYQCPKCKSRVEHAIDVCWNCGYGKGDPEQTYTDFVPPKSWRYQCRQCSARVQHAVGTCWNCNFQAGVPIDRHVPVDE